MSAIAARPQTEAGAFRAVLRRDLYVTWSELPVFLAQVILQPFFLLFVFGGNPMTYASESLRAALVPSSPHIEPWICLTVLPTAILVLIAVGIRGFHRRAID